VFSVNENTKLNRQQEKDRSIACSYIEELLVAMECGPRKSNAFLYVENIIGCSIPNSIKVLIEGEMEEKYRVFGGWSITTISWLQLEYSEMLRSPSNNPSFHNLLRVSPDFDLPAGEYISYDDSEEYSGRYKFGDRITNLKSFVPVASASHSTLLLNLGSEGFGELLSVYGGADFNVFAPNIESHLLDVLDGLQSTRYPIEQGDVVFPDSWIDRVKARENNLSINIDGMVLGGDSNDTKNTQGRVDTKRSEDVLIDERAEWYDGVCTDLYLFNPLAVSFQTTIVGYQTYKRSKLDREYFEICWNDKNNEFVAFVHHEIYGDIPSLIRPYSQRVMDVVLEITVEKRSHPKDPKSNPKWESGCWLEVTEVIFLGERNNS